MFLCWKMALFWKGQSGISGKTLYFIWVYLNLVSASTFLTLEVLQLLKSISWDNNDNNLNHIKTKTIKSVSNASKNLF